jgi:hypothetical protein
MEPKDERLSLKKFPLPGDVDFTVCPTDQVLETIAFLQLISDTHAKMLSDINVQLDKLKGRVVKENIESTGIYYVVKTAGKKMRNPIRNPVAFSDKFPDGYKRIRIAQIIDLQNMLNDVEKSPIPLGLADKWVGEEQVTEFVGFQPQRINIEVRTKKEVLR